ncbi:MAG: glycosyltransferase family 1 protein [Pedobacter sp.]|nr:MAG: glycosyltransferase family 1 protein [Pedobacter sp.]
MKKIIVIGPSIERTKGGIASVIKGMLDSDAQANGYQLIHLESHVEGSAIEKLFYLFKSLFQFLTTTKISLVHIHTASDASFYRKSIFVWCAVLRGIPVVMHVHGADFDSFYLKSKFKAYFRKTFKVCKSVIVLSNFWKVFFEKNMQLKNTFVLYNAVNCDAFSSCYTAPQNIKNFLFLGRLGERKGIYDLVNAINLLVNNEGFTDLKFYFAGDGDIAEVTSLVDKLHLSPYIEILGWVNNEMKPKILMKADTLILPSYNEGLPVALLEAMAAGKVIITTPVGGIPDLITDSVNGFLIQPGDVNAISSMIKYISLHPKEMTIIAHNNMAKINNEFNSKNVDLQLFKLYNLIID